MKHTKLLLIFLFSNVLVLGAQNFTGKVVDSNNQPIIGTTLFIKATNQGILCNEDGFYQANLAPGNYTIEYKCLGFKTEWREVHIRKGEKIELDVVLQENAFELKEVVFTQQEDPAYAIIRKAIAKAPLYANVVNSYTASAYIKGNGKITKVSKLVNRLAGKDDGLSLSDVKDQLFIQESYNEIEFTAPDTYKQTVKAFSSTMPDDMDPKESFGIMNGSIYKPKLDSYISPLNPKAFSYYRFRYEGFSEEEGRTVNKIKVISRVKDPMLLNGYIYIADDTWHVSQLELKSNVMGVKEAYNIIYQKIMDNVYLPITYAINVDFGVLGVEGVMDYFSSMKYQDLKIDEKLASEVPVEKKKRREFEIKRDEKYKVESDSLATKRDSLYWGQVRTIPLGLEELESYEKKDSIQQRFDSIRTKNDYKKFSIGDILSGGKIGRRDSTALFVEYGGLLKAFPEYNFVDGVWIGQKLDVTVKMPKGKALLITPEIYYADARKKWLWKTSVEYKYAPLRMGQLQLSGGSVSEDFNPQGITRLNNAASSLIRGRNYDFLYQKDYFSVENSIEIINGLTFKTMLEIAQRSGLSNNTNYTWGKKSLIRDNIFSGDRFDHTAYSAMIVYAPYTYYSIKDGVKKYEKTTSPAFYLQYKEGFSSWQTNNSQYRKLRGGLIHNIRLGYFDRINYQLEGGTFIGNTDKTHFTDFQHFNTSNVVMGLKSPFYSYMMLDNYQASTNRYWLRSSFDYTSQYLLLKRLPMFQGKMFSESLHLKSIYTPDLDFYTEAGYTINITPMITGGVFSSFRNFKNESVGIRLAIDWGMVINMVSQ